MAIAGRTERLIVLAIVLTAGIPLIVAIFFANTLVERAFAQAFTPELGEHLDRSLGVYHDLAKSLKEGLRHQADAIAAQEPLRQAAAREDSALVRQRLDQIFPHHPELVSLSILTRTGLTLATQSRGTALDPSREMRLEVRRPLMDGPDPPELLAVFAAPRARFDELQRATDFVRAYHHIERANVKLKRGDLYAFAVILAVTIVVAVALGTWLSRGVTTRIGTLATATHAVAAGNLAVRVPELGNDELTELSRNFNRMLSELEINRARVEFLQRMSSWQEMARRLAHEIKNPLTPIVLAVEECHRKYPGTDPTFRKLLDATLEIVEDEVGTLRRLVGEFGAFARLPHAELAPGDLGDFLREEKNHMRLGMVEPSDEIREEDSDHSAQSDAMSGMQVTFEIPDVPMPLALDRQMMHRVLTNVLRNAVQAIMAKSRTGRIEVRVQFERDGYMLVIDDDGPGVPDAMRTTIFDPYVTTKADGTGLGLAIVKKIIVEHGGTIDVEASRLGGASFRIRLPSLTSATARALFDSIPSSQPKETAVDLS